MRVTTKEGVDLQELQPIMRDQLHRVVAPAFEMLFGRQVVVTSTMTDGKHGYKSLHYLGFACDIRIWVYDDGHYDFLTEDQLYEVAIYLRKELLPGFDVVIEDTHLHIEYDPTYADMMANKRHWLQGGV